MAVPCPGGYALWRLQSLVWTYGSVLMSMSERSLDADRTERVIVQFLLIGFCSSDQMMLVLADPSRRWQIPSPGGSLGAKSGVGTRTVELFV